MISARSTHLRRGEGSARLGAGPDDRYDRLRAAFIALASSRLDGTETRSEQDRRRQLADALVEQASIRTGGWTEALCQLAVALVPGATASAVSTYDETGVAHPLAAADDRSLEIEELQQVMGEGPGYAAQVGRHPVYVDNLMEEDLRWPGYVPAARGYGIGAVWSLPVAIASTVLGSLTVYHDGRCAAEDLAWPDAMALAGLAAATMVIDADHAADHGPTERDPLDAVALASGVLAVRAGVNVDQALALLRGNAFSSDRRISDVAADVLAGVVDLS
jgi:hypothetical protein